MIILFGGQAIGGYEYEFNDLLYDKNGRPTEKARHYTVLFQAFVLMQVFNEINCRKIQPDEYNVFKGFFNNAYFLGIIIFSLVVQVLLVEVGGEIVKVVPLSVSEHLVCLALGVFCLPFSKLY